MLHFNSSLSIQSSLPSIPKPYYIISLNILKIIKCVFLRLFCNKCWICQFIYILDLFVDSKQIVALKKYSFALYFTFCNNSYFLSFFQLFSFFPVEGKTISISWTLKIICVVKIFSFVSSKRLLLKHC